MKKFKYSREAYLDFMWGSLGVLVAAVILVIISAVNVIYFDYDYQGSCTNQKCMMVDRDCTDKKIGQRTLSHYERTRLSEKCDLIDEPIRKRLNREIILWAFFSPWPFGVIFGHAFVSFRKKYIK